MLRRFTGETRRRDRIDGVDLGAVLRDGVEARDARRREPLSRRRRGGRQTRETVDATRPPPSRVSSTRRFFKTHLVIEAAAAPAVAATTSADVTSRIMSQDSPGCHEVLSKIEDCSPRGADCLHCSGATGSTARYVITTFYARLRPFINGLDAVIFEGEFGMSPCPCRGLPSHVYTLPALDAFWECQLQ